MDALKQFGSGKSWDKREHAIMRSNDVVLTNAILRLRYFLWRHSFKNSEKLQEKKLIKTYFCRDNKPRSDSKSSKQTRAWSQSASWCFSSCPKWININVLTFSIGLSWPTRWWSGGSYPPLRLNQTKTTIASNAKKGRRTDENKYIFICNELHWILWVNLYEERNATWAASNVQNEFIASMYKK